MSSFLNKLNQKVILAALLCLLPSFFISFNNVWNTYNTQLSKLRGDTDFFAEQMMNLQRQQINRAESYLKSLANTPEILSGHTQTCQNFLAQQVELNDLFSNIGSPLVTGELTCNGTPLNRVVNVQDRPYIQKAIQQASFSISKLIEDRATHALSINLAQPVFDRESGEIIRLVVGVLPFEWWQALLNDANHENLMSFITDKDGKVIARFGEQSPLLGRAFDPDLDFDNDFVLVEKQFVRGNANQDLSLAFWVALPKQQAFQEAKAEFIKSFLIIMIGLLISGLILVLSAKFLFIRPVTSLLDEFETGADSNSSVMGIENLDESIKKIALRQQQTKQSLSSTEQELIQAYHKQDMILRSVSVGIVELDESLNILSFSRRCQSYYRVLEKDLKNRHLEVLNELTHSHQVNDFQCIHQALETQSKEVDVIEVISRTDRKMTQYSDARTMYFKWAISRVNFEGSDAHWVAVVEDMTEQQLKQENLTERASTDWLTKLPNRYAIMKMIDDSIRRDTDNGFTLVLFDLNGFKLINDSFGHDVGDALIIALSQRMESLLLDDEHIGRLGGDEFLLYLPRRQAINRIQLLQHCFFEPIEVMKRTFNCSASAGISVYPKDGNDALSLIRCADLAMYEAKQSSKNDSVYYDTDLENKGIKRYEIESAIRYALSHDEFELHYQPVVNPTNNEILSAEALIRWHSLSLGTISPAVFIPIAEESGYINLIGHFVLEQVLADLERLREIYGETICINMNLSPHQLKDAILIERLTTLAEQDDKVSALILEITESTLVDEEAVHCLKKLKLLGYKIALDDFGTGFSSLSHIAKMPIHILKIDQSFISQSKHSERDLVLLKNIIAMARDLELKIIAEGVEYSEQANQLIEFGCFHMQGYLYARPKPLAELDLDCVEEKTPSEKTDKLGEV